MTLRSSVLTRVSPGSFVSAFEVSAVVFLRGIRLLVKLSFLFLTPGGCKTPAGSLVCGFEEGEENNSDGNTHTVKPTKYLPQNGEFLVIVHQ